MTGTTEGTDDPRPGEVLTATAYAVLGLLTVQDEELSVAEMKVRADYSLRHFYWSPAVSHIRREVRRLLDLGYVNEREISTHENRRSQIYHATESGREALARWVARPDPKEAVVIKNSVLLRVFLGASAPLTTALAVIDARATEVQDSIDEMNWALRRTQELGLDGTEGYRYTRAVNEFNLRSLYFEQANLAQLRARVEGFDMEAFHQDRSRRRGTLRHRRTFTSLNPDPADSAPS